MLVIVMDGERGGGTDLQLGYISSSYNGNTWSYTFGFSLSHLIEPMVFIGVDITVTIAKSASI